TRSSQVLWAGLRVEAGTRGTWSTIGLAKLGVHGALVTHVLGRPYDPSCSDAELRALFRDAKHDHPDLYEPAKRYIHGRSYGLTVAGMVLQFPHLFPTQAGAEKFARVFETMAP